MAESELHIVTGALGYSGRRIAQRLIDAGHRVRTLTNSPHKPNPFGDKLEMHPFNFDSPELLTESLRGAAALYNTYWIRFNHKWFTHSDAVANTRVLFDAAREAEVPRVVHVSITNPSADSPFEYFRGKAELEQALIDTGLSHAILRPAVLFGDEDILINNIAWMLRKFPVFGVLGRGRCRLQPIHIDDLAELAVAQGAQTESCIIDAIGPETFTLRELTVAIARIIGKRRLILPTPPIVGYLFGWLVGKCMGDVLLTWPEVGGLLADLLCTDSPPAGKTKLTDWAREHADTLGMQYANELSRRKPLH